MNNAGFKPKSNVSNICYNNKEKMNYYICGSGGCGSTIISKYLSNFGNVYHIHDRYPPDKLCYVGKENTNENVYREWFNSVEIPNDKLHLYKVIFIYRNPIYVIFSRCVRPSGPNVEHLKHIMCFNDGLIGLGDVLKTGKDLYGLEHFYDNYTIPRKRNYSIHCVKYEHFFNNIELFNKSLDIPNIKSLYPVKNETKKKYTDLNILEAIYKRLINKMNSMPFIKILEPIKQDVANNDVDV